MFARSLALLPARLVAVTPRATLARRIVNPKIIKVFDKDGNVLRDDVYRPAPSIMNPKYDDSFPMEDNIRESQSKQHAEPKPKKERSFEVPPYEKASDKKNEFKAMMTNLSLRKRREKMNLIVLEGSRLINDAIDSNIKLPCIYFTLEENIKDIKNLNEIMANNGTRLVKVLYRDMKVFSSLVTSPGVMAVAEKPDYDKLPMSHANRMPLTLVCDNVRDPGNLGTIIRTGAAVGVNKILLTSGCVDPWNDKVIKSAAGAHFRVPLHSNIAWKDLPDHLPDQFDFYLADSKNEHSSRASSSIKSSNYFEINLFEAAKANQHKVLVVANEAFGPSSESYQLAEQTSGYRVKIPLYCNVDSLNSAIASSVLLYEFRKQFECAK